MLVADEKPSEVDTVLKWKAEKFLYMASYKIDKAKHLEMKMKNK